MSPVVSYTLSSSKEATMGLSQIIDLIGGILAIIAGIIVLVKPQMVAWAVGIFFIAAGSTFVVVSLQHILP